MTEVAQASVPVHNLNSLPNDYVAKDGEEGKDGGEGSLAVDGPEGDVVRLDAVGQVSNASSSGICVCDDDDFMATINEFLEVAAT